MPQIIREVLTSVGRGFRLAFFRRVPVDATPVRAGTVLVLAVISLLGFAALEACFAGSRLAFNPYGLSAALAGLAVFAILLVVLGAAATTIPLSRAVATIFAAAFVMAIPLIGLSLAEATGHSAADALDRISPNAQGVVGAAILAWLLAVGLWTGRTLWRGQMRLPGLRLLAALLLPLLLIPMPPIVHGSKTDWTRHDVWSMAAKARKWLAGDTSQAAGSKRKRPRIDVETVYYRQPGMVQAALGRLKPSPPDRPQFYFIAAAAYAGQDVFKREVAGARAVIEERFATAGRSISLVNYHDTVDRFPLASVTNLERVLNGVGKLMNPDKDVLVLFITTHGTKGLLAVDFRGFSLNDLTPNRLAAMLKTSGIRHKVLIISACHSGSFIPALAGDDTLVMAAAHADKTSFGCESGRDWTYFGDALFNRALRSTRSFPLAFEKARTIIEGWEKKDDLTPSEPQMVIGRAIGAKLDAAVANLARVTQ